MGGIQTYTNSRIMYECPASAEINPQDIVHALSHVCRFAGHCRFFYSVAQHSLMCWLAAHEQGLSLDTQRWCLLHDAAEAYIGDMPKPFKVHMPVLNQFEADLERAVSRRFGLSWPMPDKVKEIDNRVLITERDALFSELTKEWTPWAGIKPYHYKVRRQPAFLVRWTFRKVMKNLGLWYSPE